MSGKLIPSVLNGAGLLGMLASWAGAIYLWFTVGRAIGSSVLWLVAVIPLGLMFGPIYVVRVAQVVNRRAAVQRQP